ncbi:hypothetical protein [Propioniciclava flava]
MAAGRAQVGDPAAVAHLDPEFVTRVLGRIADRVAEAVDQMRTSRPIRTAIVSDRGRLDPAP